MKPPTDRQKALYLIALLIWMGLLLYGAGSAGY